MIMLVCVGTRECTCVAEIIVSAFWTKRRMRCTCLSVNGQKPELNLYRKKM